MAGHAATFTFPDGSTCHFHGTIFAPILLCQPETTTLMLAFVGKEIMLVLPHENCCG
jgi:hypothetical protein